MNKQYYVLFLCLLLMQSPKFSYSADKSDESSLLAFKNLVTNTRSVLTRNWTANSSYCSWFGVTCSGSRRVTSLNLANMDLDGALSPSIANLSFIYALNLSGNNFHGSLPSGIWLLPRLKIIDLGNNNLEGSIPPSLFQNQNVQTVVLAKNKFTGDISGNPWIMPRLKVLNLTSNNLTGTLDPLIGNLSSIEKLILNGNDFSGEIPRGIGNLSTLIQLDFSNNHFSGPIPSSVFNLSSLRILHMGNNHLSGSLKLDQDAFLNNIEGIDFRANRLTGVIPSNLCKLPNLAYLDLSENNLTGEIPRNIGCLTKLEKFYVTDNQISGTIPPSFGNISTLEYIGCVGNAIGGEIPKELENLSRLEMLGFDFNNLLGEIPESVFNISSLVYIAFTANRLSGKIPISTGLRLPNLQGIFLADNQLSGQFPYSISNASNLIELELSYNSFTGIVPTNLGNLRQLQFLNLAANNLTNEPGKTELEFFNSLTNCSMLQFVILGDNPLNGTFPDSIGNLSSSVEMFNIQNAGIQGEIPNGIGNLNGMLSLVIDGNNLKGSVPPEIGALKQLQRLYLSQNNLRGSIPSEICYLKDLGEIILFDNNFSGAIPNCIGNLTRLQKLILGSNGLNSSIPLSFWELKSLLQVDFAQNSLQGELTTEMGNMEEIVGIDFSSNHFRGEIPRTIGNLVSLRNLSLSKNSFHGSIPSSFGSLLSLENLDLSSNSFSGTIPRSVEKLVYLKSINVSFNDLEGEIPSGGPFSNLSAASFIGNKDLCGSPQFHVPACANNRPKNSRSKELMVRIVVPIIASSILLGVGVAVLTFLHKNRKKKQNPMEPVDGFEIVRHQMLSYHELQRATDNFNESNLLGVGSFGTVYKGILSDGMIVAVKILSSNREEEGFKNFEIECEVLKRIRHRNLVRVITSCSNLEFRALVLEYMPNGSLETWLHEEEYALDFLQRVDIMLDVAMAVEYLHHGLEEKIVHCDLKPSNVVLDGDMVAHVSDFGISKILTEDNLRAQTKTLGTIGYIAPEFGSEGTVSTCGDVYSYGIMLLESMVKKRPTDEMFTESWSLKQWVGESYPNAVMEIVDPNMLDEEAGPAKEFVPPLIGLALDCSKDLPRERIDMKGVVSRLKKIRQGLLKCKASGSRSFI